MRKLALLLLVAPLALAACGSSSKPLVKVDPVAYVKQAATQTAALKSEHMVMAGKITGSGQSASVQGSGDFANRPLKGSFAIAVSGVGQDFTVKEVLARRTLYLQAPGLLGRLASGKTWAKIAIAQLHNANHLALLTQSPTQFLRQLAAAGSVKSLGTEVVDGVETTHYLATTHYQLGNLDASKSAPGSKLAALVYGPIDVWIGNRDGYVYREKVSASATSGGQSASSVFRVDFSKFDEAVTVTVPLARETADMGKGLGG